MPPIVWIILVFIVLIVVPKVGMAVCLPIIAIWFVGEVGIMGTFIRLIPLALVMTLALEISPKAGYVIRQSFAQRKINTKKLISHILFTLASTYIVMLALILLGHLFVKIIGDFAIILLIACGILAGIAFGILAKSVSEGNLGSYDEISKKLEQQRREAELQAERDRVAAEVEAHNKRIDTAAATLEGIWNKALQQYGDVGGFIGEVGMPINGLRCGSLYSGITMRRHGVPLYYEGKRVDPMPPNQVWVTNDKRIQAINDIIWSTGLFGDGPSPQFNNEAPNLLNLLARAKGNNSAPLLGCQIPHISLLDGPAENKPWVAYLEDVMNHFYKKEFEATYIADFYEVLKYYEAEYFGIKAGIDGENYVKQTLDMHEGEFFAMYDVRLEFPGADGKKESVETDVLILAPNGLFAVEIKNYGSTGSYSIVVTADGQWFKQLPGARGKREPIANPVSQNDRHIAFLSKFINSVLGRNMMNSVAIENVVALANDNVETDIHPNAPLTITRAGNLYACIMRDRTQKFTLEELTLIKSELEKRSLPAQSFPLDDHSEYLRTLIRYDKVAAHGATIMVRAKREHPEWFTNL